MKLFLDTADINEISEKYQDKFTFQGLPCSARPPDPEVQGLRVRILHEESGG